MRSDRVAASEKRPYEVFGNDRVEDDDLLPTRRAAEARACRLQSLRAPDAPWDRGHEPDTSLADHIIEGGANMMLQ